MVRAAVAHYNAGRATHGEYVLRSLDTAVDTPSRAGQAIEATVCTSPVRSRIIRPLALRLTTALVHARHRRAAGDPDAYADFASSLFSLGTLKLGTGRQAEALAPLEQAVGIQRRLAAADPATDEPELAASLSGLGDLMARAGRSAEALSALEQAMDIHRRLAVDAPAAPEPVLMGCVTSRRWCPPGAASGRPVRRCVRFRPVRAGRAARPRAGRLRRDGAAPCPDRCGRYSYVLHGCV